MTQPLAQIIIFMDATGTIRAEAPGQNGMRRKIDLPLDFETSNPEIVAELRAQIAAAQARDRQAALDLKRRVYETMCATPGQGVEFANRIIENPPRMTKPKAMALFGDLYREALAIQKARETTRDSKPRTPRVADPNLAIELDL